MGQGHGDGARRGVEAAEKEQRHGEELLVVVEWPAVDLGVEKDAHQVLAPRLAPPLLEPLDDAHHHAHGGFTDLLVVDAPQAGDVVDPAGEVGPVLVGEADHAQRHLLGKGDGKGPTELDRPVLRNLRDELLGQRPPFPLLGPDGLGRERRVDDPAVLLVQRRVGVDRQELGGDRGRARPVLRGERRRVTGGGHDVGVAGDDPEAAVVVAAGHGLLLPQRGPELVGIDDVPAGEVVVVAGQAHSKSTLVMASMT